MADNGNTQDTLWPLPKFRFEVDFGTDLMGASFQEVSGLDSETQIIEYRNGNSQQFSAVKMPGIKKYGNITFKKGLLANSNGFWDWFNEIKMNTIKRRSVTIKLLDEAGNVAMQWILLHAWPTKITGTDLKTDGNETAIETIEMAHEGITLVNNG